MGGLLEHVLEVHVVELPKAWQLQLQLLKKI